ncbi:hypothetical protein, partial [Rhodoblastus sp.]|uniref:hypothetical protein n=1 Tax=Rhodoblastus sp. TaxID=1962975 RepID=UPI003F9BC44D
MFGARSGLRQKLANFLALALACANRSRTFWRSFRRPPTARVVLIRIPNEPFGIRIPLARKSARDIEDFRAMAFPRIAKQSCGNRIIRQ